MFDHILPFLWIGGFGDEFQVAYVLPDCSAELMPESRPRECASVALPGLGQSLESDVLSEGYPAKASGALKEVGIVGFSKTVFNCGADIYLSSAQLLRDSCRDVNIHVKADRHSEQSLGPHAREEWRARARRSFSFDLLPLRADLFVDLLLVVKVISHCSMRLGGCQI
jgi:hypothetical protein